MRIVVTGTQGQVALSLRERAVAFPHHEVVLLGRPDLDLTRPETIAPAITSARPDLVVSAAAYTAVDQAESEPDVAFLVNKTGAGEVARAARLAGVPVVHLSTDYVFAGDQAEPYDERVPTGPKGVYGASKLAGEAAVAAANPDHLIMRTAWVYSPFGKNFVRTMLTVAKTRDTLNVVDDQHGNPTSALDIADAIFAVAEAWQSGVGAKRGVYHFAGTGETTWCGFARHIFETSRALGGPYADVTAITSDQYPTKAVRPKNSRLISDRFATDFGYRSPDWRDSTNVVVERLIALI